MAEKDTDSGIESRFSFKCSKRWEELTEAGDDKVKLCNQCNESVHLVESLEELDKHSENDRCVALKLKKKQQDYALTGLVELTEPLHLRQKGRGKEEVTQGCGSSNSKVDGLDIPDFLIRSPAIKAKEEEIEENQPEFVGYLRRPESGDRSPHFSPPAYLGRAVADFPYQKKKPKERLFKRLLRRLGFNKGA
ncbi:MAG: hypothetical protein ACR2PX_21320 [Endozoicomonas sp.]|uniref:hypothetical protein n=1 Tax=Endozoicomonas sp. TaxID=1892382 RepID=UPI003D9BFAAC